MKPHSIRPAASPTATRAVWASRVTVLAAMAASFAAAAYLGLHSHGVSPFDETPHFDYVYRIMHGELPPTASHLSQEAIWQSTCRGGGWTGHTSGACAHLPLDQVPDRGINYVLMYFPLYYSVVAPFAGLLHALGMNLWDACRLMSATFYSAGIGLLTASLIRLSLSRRAALGVGLGVMALPFPLYLGSTITPDSLAILAGSAPLFLLTLRTSWERRLVVGAVIAVLIALAKPNFLPLAGITVLLAIVGPVAGSDRTTARWWHFTRPELLRSFLALAAPAVAAVSWQLFRSTHLAPGETSPDGGLTAAVLAWHGSLGGAIVQAAPSLLQPLNYTPYAVPASMTVLLTAIEVVVVGGAVTMALTQRGSAIKTDGLIAVAGVSGLLFAAVYLPTTFYVSFHSTGTQSRYIFPMWPLLVAAVALSVKSRAGNWLLFSGGLAFAAFSAVVLHQGVA